MRRIEVVLATLFAVFFLSSIALAVDCPIPDTGQTKCYDNSQEIPCPLRGQPFYGQDAQIPCNPQSYTMLAGRIMVQDNVTGLIWESKNDDNSIHDKDNTYNWNDAQGVFIATINSQNFGGYSDWRLPTVKELSFLVDKDRYDPSINTTYFPDTESLWYWSSTTNASYPYCAWGVDFNHGDVDYHYRSSNYYYVRAVRGGQCGEFGNFIDNGDGTVTDTDTGLMWQKGTAPGNYTWQQALSYCESLSLGEHNDWRLPNVNELQSLVDYTRYDPSIDTTYFPNTVSDFFWSSTTSAHYPNGAWLVYFYYGNINVPDKSSYGYVRAVRTGQCGSFTTTTTVASTSTTISGSTTTTIQSCPTEELYGEYSEEAELLRNYRDSVLAQSHEGQELIRLYYELSPVIVAMMNEDEGFKEQVKEMIDGVLELVKAF